MSIVFKSGIGAASSGRIAGGERTISDIGILASYGIVGTNSTNALSLAQIGEIERASARRTIGYISRVTKTNSTCARYYPAFGRTRTFGS